MSILGKVLNYVKTVVEKAKISKTVKGKQYCFLTIFRDGIIVYAEKNKKSRLIVISVKGLNKSVEPPNFQSVTEGYKH